MGDLHFWQRREVLLRVGAMQTSNVAARQEHPPEPTAIPLDPAATVQEMNGLWKMGTAPQGFHLRNVTHPMFLRRLMNRNPLQTNRNFAQGHDQWLWAKG